MDTFALFFSFLRASAFSVGGLASLPLLRDELVVPGVVSEQQVVEALTIGRLSTGPNGLYVVSLGYFAHGWVGAGVALLATSLPPLLLVPAVTLVRRQLLSPWAAGMMRGMALSTAGLLLATAVHLLAPGTTVASAPLWQIVLAASAAMLTVHGRAHPALLLAGGAVGGIILTRLAQT